MSSARRPLLTATAAGTLLGALWFVPNANATQDAPARTAATPQATAQARAANTISSDATATSAADGDGTGDGTRLADTGSFDTTPYVVGGTTLLALGAGFVVYSVRRERLGF
ncbi:LPXTG cell wall anchor domain-containing protein [Streptomyces sp. NPDC014995]|uniref:LPXTG cell wall anchor domain-containing protein n=1 Tax=Streptomyces sp. NPDC014995 TaxID=3364936 RepID=UPI0036FB92B5